MKAANFKILSGKYPLGFAKRLVPKDKQEEELFISELLKNALEEITEITLSDDDSNKGSDTKCIWNGKEKGIQVTRFAISNSRSTAIVAQKLSIKILKNIYPRLNPKYRTIISFDSIFDDSNEIVKLKKKKLEKLCNFIVEKVSNHKHIHAGKKGWMYSMFPYPIEVPEFLKPEVTSILIQHPPDNHFFIYLPGKDKIWINWNFDRRTIDENIVETESKSIFEKKNEGKSEILLIWCNGDEVFFRINEIRTQLEFEFQRTTFEYVFLIVFPDRDGFQSHGFELHTIKKKNQNIELKLDTAQFVEGKKRIKFPRIS